MGIYRVYNNGVLISESKNLLTTTGKEFILRYLARDVSDWSGVIAIGIGDTAATVDDERLEFELSQSEVDVRIVNVANEDIIVKATIEQQVVGEIHELGIYSVPIGNVSRAPDLMITQFDPDFLNLSNSTTDSDNVRIGTQSAKVDATASSTTTAVIESIYQDYSTYQNNDEFVLAYYLHDANCTDIALRFVSSSGNYYAYNFAPPSASGYNIHTVSKGSFAATGAPDWAEVVDLEFDITAGASDTAVSLDGLRLNDTDPYPELALVSRSVLGTPIVKDDSQSLDIEYTLDLTF